MSLTQSLTSLLQDCIHSAPPQPLHSRSTLPRGSLGVTRAIEGKSLPIMPAALLCMHSGTSSMCWCARDCCAEACMPCATCARQEAAGLGPALCYEDILEAERGGLPGFRWVRVREDDGCGLCYTSGTTGRPKVSAACLALPQKAWREGCHATAACDRHSIPLVKEASVHGAAHG